MCGANPCRRGGVSPGLRPPRRSSSASCRSQRSRDEPCGSHGSAQSAQPHRQPRPAPGCSAPISRPPFFWPRHSPPRRGFHRCVCCRPLRLLGLHNLSNHGRGTNTKLALTNDGVDAGNVALHGTDATVALKLCGRGLEEKVKQLFLCFFQFCNEALCLKRIKLAGCEFFCSNGHYASPSSRLMMRALSGNLWMARVIASRASSSDTPATSNNTRPGLTLATHHSGDPLPEPMRVSAGFFVSGPSG